MATTKKKSSKKGAKKSAPKKKSTAKKSSGGGGGALGPVYSKLSALQGEVRELRTKTATDGQLASLKSKVAKIEAHAKGQDKALMALAEHADAQDQQILNLQRSRDEILTRLGDAGEGGGYRSFKVV